MKGDEKSNVVFASCANPHEPQIACVSPYIIYMTSFYNGIMETRNFYTGIVSYYIPHDYTSLDWHSSCVLVCVCVLYIVFFN